MPGFLIIFLAIVDILPGTALAQQAQRQPQQSDADIKNACREEARQLCINTFPPIPIFVQRCLADNRSKLSEQCRASIPATRPNRDSN
jgi:hypothetical protein